GHECDRELNRFPLHRIRSAQVSAKGRSAVNAYQRALDEVGHHSVDEQGRRMTVEQIAERIGEPPSRLRKELSAYDDAHPLKAEKVVPLTLATRNKALVRYFAEA